MIKKKSVLPNVETQPNHDLVGQFWTFKFSESLEFCAGLEWCGDSRPRLLIPISLALCALSTLFSSLFQSVCTTKCLTYISKIHPYPYKSCLWANDSQPTGLQEDRNKGQACAGFELVSGLFIWLKNLIFWLALLAWDYKQEQDLNCGLPWLISTSSSGVAWYWKKTRATS